MNTEERLDSIAEHQRAFHEEFREYIGQANEFRERMLEFKEDVCNSHDALVRDHNTLSKRVSWIIGVGSAAVFLTGVVMAWGGM